MRKVYFDNAATTQVRNEVVEKISEVLATEYGNPSSTHSFGRSSKSVLENCRKEIAAHFKVSAAEIIFTSGGTEADNLILNSCVRDLEVKRIITSKVEHHAVLHTIESLANTCNLQVDIVHLDAKGMVDYTHLENLLKSSSKKTLVSLMHVNNEVGNKLDIAKVAVLCKENSSLFHSDTVQSVGHYKLDFSKIPLDFAAVSAHKFHGPKGVGFAFIRKNSGLKPLIIGGEQERGLRAGTEAVYAIAGLTKALEISYRDLEKEVVYIKGVKNYFKEQLLQEIPSVKLNGYCGDNEKSTYTLLNILLPISPEKATMLLFQLDLKGIACSKGSACQSGAVGGSHVLTEILSKKEMQYPSIRFSFSIFNTLEEVDYVIGVLKKIINN
ncbi:MAG: cysteine desulfurase [Flavobacteriaceae bacterium]|nr:cysteine desulfurase [Flavobacteriaceae bacterium]